MPAPDAPWFYQWLQRLIGWLFRLLGRLEVTGIEHVPSAGAVIVAPNHLYLLDVVVMFVAMPRQVTVFAAEKWRVPPFGWLLGLVGNAIYVRRGGMDRDALAQALRVLQAGKALGLAPEGTRSPTGGLQPGKDGVAYLAGRSAAPVLPVATWGQERIFWCWRHLRRPEIHVQIGEPIRLPPEAARAHSDDLRQYTDQIMLVLARMLPQRYRGVYEGRVQGF